MLSEIVGWFLGLGEKYHVNPIVFGSIYVGAIPFFFLSLMWLTNNIRKQKSILFPVLAVGICFISAYLYLLVAGRNIPLWVYFMIACLVSYGAYSTFLKLRSRIKNPD